MPVRDTRAMLAGMTPVPREGCFVFCTTKDDEAAGQAQALAFFREDEGCTLILETSIAAALGFDISQPMRRIVLEVFSALDGVGLTAAVATALASEGIPCNVVAAYHHDNVFVPDAMADRALQVLRDVQARALG